MKRSSIEMSKTKTLFTMALLVLLGSMGAAQAQDRLAEVKLFTTPEAFAREGGKNEAAGSILLNSSDERRSPQTGATIMLITPSPCGRYRATITKHVAAGGVTVTGLTQACLQWTGMAENEDNDGNGTITIDPDSALDTNLLIQGVMLDVSGAMEPLP